MGFQEWIINETPRRVAKRLRVDPSAVSSWQNRKSCPRPENMRRICELSQGAVTYADIIHHYLRVRKSKKA